MQATANGDFRGKKETMNVYNTHTRLMTYPFSCGLCCVSCRVNLAGVVG